NLTLSFNNEHIQLNLLCKGGMMYHHDFNEKIGFWYVIALAGQSNGMAYGEGIPLPDTLDKPESRVKQLARRKTITPGGKECKFNEIIP
ncbi:hypothetical protein OFB84_31375, partial [Escherichia coli]|nr:hypothetical protein [Escherichia coli]